MLSRSVLALLVAGATGSAVAQEATDKVNALYFHPISTIVTASVDVLPMYIPLTYERELDGGKSITVQPTLLIGSISSSGDDNESYYAEPDWDFFGIGVLGAFRKYFNGSEAEGVYVAPALGFSYSSVTRDGNQYYESSKVSATGISVLGYLGYRGKWDGATLYVDLGLGRSFVSVSGDDEDAEGISGSGLAVDLNLGVGFPF